MSGRCARAATRDAGGATRRGRRGGGGGEVGNGHRVATGCFSLEGGPVLFSLGPHAPRGCEVDFSHVLFFFIFLSLFG